VPGLTFLRGADGSPVKVTVRSGNSWQSNPGVIGRTITDIFVNGGEDGWEVHLRPAAGQRPLRSVRRYPEGEADQLHQAFLAPG